MATPTEQDKKCLKHTMDTICATCKERHWQYTVEEDKNKVRIKFDGKDFPIELIFRCMETRNLIQILSFMPYKIKEEYRLEGAYVTSHANHCMGTMQLNGGFDYKYADGTILFRMCTSYRDSIISQSLIVGLVAQSIFIIEKYIEPFFMVGKGVMSVEEFMVEN